MKSRVFKERTSLKTAKDLFLNSIIPLNKTNILRVEECQGRITSKDIISDMNVPHYNRAAMDGYAVKAENITSASISSPIMLTLSDKISNSTCVRVHTGSKIPDGADAVVMVEDTEQKGSLVEFFTKVHPGKNVGHIGEDIRIGDIIVNANHLLRGCDLATIASCGIEEIEVYEKPNVAIIPTGNELVKRSKQSPPPGKISETNSLMVGAYVEKWGGHPLYSDIIVDDPLLIEKEIKKNIDADLIVVCGGTSVGERDYVPTVLDKIGTLLVHGIGISPGKPTALGSFNDIPVICLPGYPAAGLITLFEFAAPAIKKLSHIKEPNSFYKQEATLQHKITSKIGYVTYTRVKLDGNKAIPLMTSGAGIMSTVTQADGFVKIGENIEGINEGDTVEVFLIE